ncbi:MAG: tRNA (adenosine(37)-N6)-threonylcarbamoyltransferase complex ATPase subunit type 1 TsaE [Aestuariivirgaceae bacterium]
MAERDSTFVHRRHLGSESDTGALAHELALFVKSGDWLGLIGDLGAGKTTFARALIQALRSDDDTVEVPSPTFTLVQLYDDCRVPVAHFDFYRLTRAGEVEELGIDDLADSHLIVAEWAERLGDQLPQDRLMIEFKISGNDRAVTLTGYGTWRKRLARFVDAGDFVNATAPNCERQFLQGDASTRRYERLIDGVGSTRLLMDMPAKTEPRPAGGGETYGEQVHLADDIRAVVAVNQELRRQGFSAAKVEAVDMDKGFAIVEDFGDKVYGAMAIGNEDMSEPMTSAVEMLADVAARQWPADVKVDHARHILGAYDGGALMTAAGLLMTWFWPIATGQAAPQMRHDEYARLWQPLFETLTQDRAVWVLRDYHSPNLIWLPERDGAARVGIIDTQDAVLGPPAYDLVSLLQDARVDVADEAETQLLNHYIARREQAEPGFDEAQFRRSYAIMGAQRAAKILGIFARLSKRDGKHGYLRHIPRVSHALEKNLAHPALAAFKHWFAEHLPADQREAIGSRVQ